MRLNKITKKNQPVQVKTFVIIITKLSNYRKHHDFAFKTGTTTLIYIQHIIKTQHTQSSECRRKLLFKHGWHPHVSAGVFFGAWHVGVSWELCALDFLWSLLILLMPLTFGSKLTFLSSQVWISVQFYLSMYVFIALQLSVPLRS